MSFVIDASLTLSWYFEDERTAASDAVLDRLVGSSALAPPLWRLEVANGLQVAIRRKRIDAGFRDAALQQLTALPIRIEPDCDTLVWTTTLSLADPLRANNLRRGLTRARAAPPDPVGFAGCEAADCRDCAEYGAPWNERLTESPSEHADSGL